MQDSPAADLKPDSPAADLQARLTAKDLQFNELRMAARIKKLAILCVTPEPC